MKNLSLVPASFVFSLVSKLRNLAYDHELISSYQSTLPVVCVGNLTVGGNGKTPLVIELVREFQQRGLRPVVLSRGYGGKLIGPELVKRSHQYWEVGDEPLLIFSLTKVPVIVSRNRAAGARYIEENGFGDIIILDDGYQHRKLQREVNIVCVNVSDDEAESSFMEGRSLPLGRFRENPRDGLKRATCVVLSERRPRRSGTARASNITDYLPPTLPVFRSYLVIQEFPLKKNAEVVAVCGLGNPEGFMHTLTDLGLNIVERYLSPDHVPFSEEDIEKIKLDWPNTPLVCTEKDLVKIPRHLRPSFIPVKVILAVEPRDEFYRLLLSKVLNG